jgi:uncharacterized protein YggE
VNQSDVIATPWGMSVFGAATIDVAPDLARLRIGIKEMKPTPQEAFLVEVVAAGVNEVGDVQFDVKVKRELRAQARKAAVVAAREKAEVYAEAAEVRVGRVLHITDVDSDGLRTFRSHGQVVGNDGDGALTPGMISVSAGVLLGYEIKE